MADRRGKPSSSSKKREGKRKADASMAPATSDAGRSTPLGSLASPIHSATASSSRSADDTSTPGKKVAIPRLPRSSDLYSTPTTKPEPKPRLNHACTSCRQRKTKCSGDRPSCKHCTDIDVPCVYSDRKRDRVKREHGYLVHRLELYEQLFKDVLPQVDLETQVRIEKLLSKLTFDDDEGASTAPSIAAPRSEAPDADDDHSDSDSLASVGMASTGSADQIHEDFNMNSVTRATGFLGKISDVRWMHLLRLQESKQSTWQDATTLGARAGNVDEYGPRLQGPESSAAYRASPISDSTYHLDDIDLSTEPVDAYQMPVRKHAERLVSMYFESVHHVFPVIGKINFVRQVELFFDKPQSQPGHNWLTILHLIFAISARYSHLGMIEGQGHERDHIIYFERARKLGMDADAILMQPDLQRVQILGLVSFYLMSMKQINRAWTSCGMAMRYSVALGLHLRNESDSMDEANKEIRYRVWWALFCLDHTLVVMTGRPVCISENDFTTPLPVIQDEEALFDPRTGKPQGALFGGLTRISSRTSLRALMTPTTGLSSSGFPAEDGASASTLDYSKATPGSYALYFVLHIRLSLLTGEVFSQLYAPGAFSLSWSGLRKVMAKLDSKLENWLSGLPTAMDFSQLSEDQRFVRQRMSLGFFYYSTKMIIHRPCLRRTALTQPSGSRISQAVSVAGARRCVHAAVGIMGFFPNEPDSVNAFRSTPWWCLTHHMMQAATVLLLELSFNVEHCPGEGERILDTTKKILRWLWYMSSTSQGTHRAWKYCSDELERVCRVADPPNRDLARSLPSHGYSANNTQMPLTTAATATATANAQKRWEPWQPGSSSGAFPPSRPSPLQQQAPPPLHADDVFGVPAQPLYAIYHDYPASDMLDLRPGPMGDGVLMHGLASNSMVDEAQMDDLTLETQAGPLDGGASNHYFISSHNWMGKPS